VLHPTNSPHRLTKPVTVEALKENGATSTALTHHHYHELYIMAHPLVEQYLEEGHTREDALILAKRDTALAKQLKCKNIPAAEAAYFKSKLSGAAKQRM